MENLSALMVGQMDNNILMAAYLVWQVIALIACRALLKHCANFKGIPDVLRLITYVMVVFADSLILTSLLFIFLLITRN